MLPAHSLTGGLFGPLRLPLRKFPPSLRRSPGFRSDRRRSDNPRQARYFFFLAAFFFAFLALFLAMISSFKVVEGTYK